MVSFAIAAPHTAASEAGLEAFTRGGNAVDAALAACAVLTVVYPHMCTIGGDLFALVHAPDGAVRAYNGSGAAPAGLRADVLRRSHRTMPLRGPDTVTVPGILSGWSTLASHGRLRLGSLMESAIRHAEEGCLVSSSLARALRRDVDVVAGDPGLRSLFYSSGSPLGEGDSFRQPALAKTLRRIAGGGVDEFYKGIVGEDYLRGLTEAGSAMSRSDLASHETLALAPLVGHYRGWEIATSPPNSQGYCLLLILAILDRLSLRLDALGPQAGRIAEVFRRVSADRDDNLCDANSLRFSLADLVSKERVIELAEQVNTALGPRLDSPSTSAFGGGAKGDTVAVVAADGDGWGVSIIQSTFDSFGSGFLEQRTGILSHNRGACFTLDATSPNVLEGGKRPLHTLMPVLVKRDGRLAVVAGTMGGRSQPQINAQLLGGIFNTQEGLGNILAGPRWVVGALNDSDPNDVVLAEPEAMEFCGASLRESGMDVQILESYSDEVGHAQYIRIQEGSLEAASDPRADGSAIVT